MPKVSVVIPVYNVEAYIERCLHTLFSQTLDDIEYIFVDDGSTDRSEAIISEILGQYPHRIGQTKILKHEQNRGVAAARATGILAAAGDYIVQCDPDDFVEVEMYEKLYNRALDSNADIVACYYWEERRPDRHELVARRYGRTPQDCLENIYKKNCYCGSLWDKLVKRTLITEHQIIPYEACDHGEDLNCVVRMLYYARSIVVVQEPLYHYCRRDDSLTGVVKDARFLRMRMRGMDRIRQFLGDEKRYATACRQMSFYLKMECRTAFDGDENAWFELYSDSHRDILKYNDMPLKGRLFWWFALRNKATYGIMRKMISRR